MSVTDFKFQNPRDYLLSVKHEAMKLYRIYDQYNRCIIQYETVSTARDGETCFKTQYTYNGQTKDVVQMKESLDNWSSAWDL